MALDILECCTAKHHPHVDEDVIPNLGCFTNNDTHPMIDDHPAADYRTGMDFNTREERPIWETNRAQNFRLCVQSQWALLWNQSAWSPG